MDAKQAIRFLRLKANVQAEYDNNDYAADNYRKIADLIEQLAQQRQWIPVSDHMPDVSKLILLYGGSGWIGCGWLKSNGIWFIDSDDGKLERSRAFVTHWQPLPEPPGLDGDTNAS